MERDVQGGILIDTHCHLNDPSFEGSVDDVLSRAREKGVTACVVPAYDRASLPRTLELAGRYPKVVFPAFGIHPWYLDGGGLEDVEYCLKRPGTSAVGEIGLDLAQGMPAQEVQKKALVAQLDMAANLGLPVIIHCRKAHGPLYDILTVYRGKMDVVLHSFSGSFEVMERFIDLGCYISFSGSVTRQGAKKYHRCARYVPEGRLLLETDAPSIATQTTVASRVEPCHVVEVARKVAEVRGTPYDEVCRISTRNAARVFSMPAASGEP